MIHNGDADVQHLCMRYRARCKTQIPGVTLGAYAMDAFYNWLLLLLPGEELSTETLSSIGEWRQKRKDECAGYMIRDLDGHPRLRFINRAKFNWIGEFPPVPTDVGVFPGSIVSTNLRRAA